MTQERERIDITIKREKCPDLFNYIEESKSKTPQYSYPDLLNNLIQENQQLKAQVISPNEWTGIRLALRATEKNTHLTLELLNTLLLNSMAQPSSIRENKSAHLAFAETNWKDYMQNVQAKQSTTPTSSPKVFGREKEDVSASPEATQHASFDPDVIPPFIPKKDFKID